MINGASDDPSRSPIGVRPDRRPLVLCRHLDRVNQLTLPPVRITSVDQWSEPGLLPIGDAAHVISPVGGNGLNFAVLDAVAAANRLVGPLLADVVDPAAVDVATAAVETAAVRWSTATSSSRSGPSAARCAGCAPLIRARRGSCGCSRPSPVSPCWSRAGASGRSPRRRSTPGSESGDGHPSLSGGTGRGQRADATRRSPSSRSSFRRAKRCARFGRLPDRQKLWTVPAGGWMCAPSHRRTVAPSRAGSVG